MKRRRFLKTTLASAGAVFVGAGCGSDNGSESNQSDDTQPSSSSPYKAGDAWFPQSVASGDPRPDGVILWTRVQDEADPTGDIDLELQIALDEAFTQRVAMDGKDALTVTAKAEFDHCVKVRLVDLGSATTYYYRFVYTRDDGEYASRTGRTRTAPAPDEDVAVKFAFVSCQDFNGRYYNTHAKLAKEPLDFWVHLGDYVYETTGNPSFQDTAEGRTVLFSKPEEGIVFNEGTESEYYAAKSLSNYRDLYKIYRTDKDLQTMHERAPVIAIWDDHEFSDDSHGATATYYGGRQDETDVPRRKAANQAWFEYMPVDYLNDPEFQYDPAIDYPNDLKIYRDFVYGKHVHLLMTDLRTYRSPHIIPGNALPGAVILTEEDLKDAVGSVPDNAVAYLDIDAFENGVYRDAIRDKAADLDIDGNEVKGHVTVEFINAQVEALAKLDVVLDAISEADAATLERGYAYAHLGKMSGYGSMGSRYLVGKAVYDLYAAKRYKESNGESELGMGAEQEAWFLATAKASKSTWKVWGNEYCLSPLQVNLSEFDLPAAFKQTFYLLAEDWNGQRNRRDVLLSELSDVGNVVAITGDIHAFFAGVPYVNDDTNKRIPEFVCSSVASGSFQSMLIRYAESDPALAAAGAVSLAYLAETLLVDEYVKPNPHLGFANIDEHGFALVDVDGDEFEVTYFSIPENEVKQRVSDDELDGKFSTKHFKVEAGSHDLYHRIDDAWKRWDLEKSKWI